jgi:hypothetical protein
VDAAEHGDDVGTQLHDTLAHPLVAEVVRHRVDASPGGVAAALQMPGAIGHSGRRSFHGNLGAARVLVKVDQQNAYRRGSAGRSGTVPTLRLLELRRGSMSSEIDNSGIMTPSRRSAAFSAHRRYNPCLYRRCCQIRRWLRCPAVIPKGVRPCP